MSEIVKEIRESAIAIIKEWKHEDPFRIKLRFSLIVILIATVSLLGYFRVFSGEATAGLIGGLLGYLLAEGGRVIGRI